MSVAARVLEQGAGPAAPAPPPRDIRSELSLRRQAQDMADRHEAVRRLRYERWLGARPVAYSHQRGQALVEYALVISLIALVSLTALQTGGVDFGAVLHTLASEV